MTEAEPEITEQDAAEQAAPPEAEIVEPEPGEDPEEDIPFEEAEEPDEEPPEPEAQLAPQGLSEQAAEKAAKDAESDWKRFAQRTLDRWGPESAHMAECPLCLPQHKGFVDMRWAGRVPDPVVKAIQQYLGIAQEVEYVQDEDARECPRCSGLGKVRTGSKVPTQLTRVCGTCNGYGYVPPPSTQPKSSGTNGHAELTALPGEPVPADDFEHGDMDEFQQPRLLPDGRENPNYGRRPAYWIEVEPYGSTVGLKAQDAPV